MSECPHSFRKINMCFCARVSGTQLFVGSVVSFSAVQAWTDRVNEFIKHYSNSMHTHNDIFMFDILSNG